MIDNRHYDAFGALAGVRRDGPKPKGLPANLSDLAKLTITDNIDLHSHTWYTLAEAIEIFATVQHWDRNFETLMPSRFTYLANGENTANFRVLFAFDN